MYSKSYDVKLSVISILQIEQAAAVVDRQPIL